MDVLRMLQTCAGAVCALTLAPAPVRALEALAEAPLTVVVLDRSGSMGDSYEWLAELTMRVDAQLGDPAADTRRYGLVEFVGAPKVITLGGGALGNVAALGQSLRSVEASDGGEEDGYRAVHFALTHFAPLRSVAMSVLLVSNEDRDALQPALNIDGLAGDLARAGVVLDALVNVRFRCADGREALGTTAAGTGYVATPDRGIERCDGVQAEGTLPAAQTTITDYVQLALRSGGTAWNIYQAWGPEHIVGPFANAFAMALRERERDDAQIETRVLIDVLP